jgi:4,5-DOPA dioxygenase extradiol
MTPAIFFGHGTPMNAIENNFFTQSWQDSIFNLPQPRAIVIISAH